MRKEGLFIFHFGIYYRIKDISVIDRQGFVMSNRQSVVLKPEELKKLKKLLGLEEGED